MKDNFFNNLDNIFEKNDIKSDLLNKEKYRNDWSTDFQSNPIAIVFPKTIEQVVDVIRLSNEFKYPLIGSGGRTGLSGGASALSNELIVSFDKMDQLLDFDDQSKTVLCQPGMVTQNLQIFADDNNLYYPVNFSSAGSSQIGGNIATNAGGIRVIKYGLTGRYVVGLNVVTGSGKPISIDNMLVKNATGPDIKNFFIGSEGILALTTSCRIQLIAKPKETNVVLIGFSRLSSLDILVNAMLQFDVEALEFFTRNSIISVNKAFDSVDVSHLKSNYYLIIELHEQNKFNDCLEKIYTDDLAQEIIISSNNSQKESLWKYRLLISESISRRSPIKFDIAVPVKNISSLIHDLENFIKENNSYHLILFGHLGDGNLHVNLLNDSKSRNLFFVENNIYNIVLGLGGTISAEHGIGVKKTNAFMRHENNEKIALLQNLKNHFDPNKILNPGKLVE
jgi:FAD/FMN-containing dehydrogenase